MKDKIHEQLSALLDDELADSEQSLLIRQLVRDPALSERLLHYQTISDALHDNLPQQVDTRFLDRFQRLANERRACDGIVFLPGLEFGRINEHGLEQRRLARRRCELKSIPLGIDAVPLVTDVGPEAGRCLPVVVAR